MHFRVYLIVDKDEKITNDSVGTHMEKYHQDNQDYFRVNPEIDSCDVEKEAKNLVKILIKDEDSTIEDLFNKIEKYKRYNHRGDYAKTLMEEYGFEKDADGNLGNCYNPYSFYDWFVVGGRHDGFLSGNRHETDNGFNFGEKCHSLKNNTTSIKDYRKILKDRKDALSYYIVSYKEDDYIASEGWDYKDMIKFLKDYDEQDKIIILDCHN